MRFGFLSLLFCLAYAGQAPLIGAQSPASTAAIPAASVMAGTNNAGFDLAALAASLSANRNYQCHIVARTEKSGVEAERYEIEMKCHGRDMLLAFTKPYSMVKDKVMRKGSHLWLISRDKNTRPILLSPSQFGDKLHIGPLFDILVIDWQNYSLTNLPHQVVDGRPCFVIEFNAHNQSVLMDSIKAWIDQNTLQLIKTDFYDEDRKALYHCIHDDIAVSTNIEKALRPRRFTVTVEGDDTRYIYEATDFQRVSDGINWDDLFFKQ